MLTILLTILITLLVHQTIVTILVLVTDENEDVIFSVTCGIYVPIFLLIGVIRKKLRSRK